MTEYEDYISRKTVVEEMKKRHKNGDVITVGYIKSLPSIYPKQKTGRWIKTIDEDGSEYWLCSECRCGSDKATNFCPECGSDNSEG